MVLNEWTTQASAVNWVGTPPPTVVDPFASARYRVITQAFRVYYSGQANTCSGIVTATTDSISVEAAPAVNGSAIAYNTYTAGVPTSGSFNTDTVYMTRITAGSNPTVILPSTVQQRPETGCNILVKHTGPDYEWINMPEYGIVPVASGAPTNAWGSVVTGISNPGYILLDPGWESVTVGISGATTGTTFRVECIMCVEYEPTPNSNVARFAKTPMTSSPGAVAAVDAIAKTIPTTVPLNQSMQPWVRMALRALSGASAGLGGMIGGPLGAGVASAITGGVAGYLA